jgi:hypothetical protein
VGNLEIEPTSVEPAEIGYGNTMGPEEIHDIQIVLSVGLQRLVVEKFNF